jgi:transposase
MYLFCSKLNKPVYFRLINGNVADVTSMKLCLKEMQISNAILVADKGFYSNSNVQNLEKEGLQHLIPLHRNNKIIDYDPLKTDKFKRNKQFFVYQKRIIWYHEYEKDGRKYVTFLDERLRLEEEVDFLQRNEEEVKAYSGDELMEKMLAFGTLTFVYRTNSPKTAQELYEIYKQRNEIEVMFDSYKNFLEADKTYMQNRYVLDGWLFVNFIAMIAYYKLFDRLRGANLLNKISPKDILEWSKSVYQHRIVGENGWAVSSIPTKYRNIFARIEVAALT